MLKPVNGHILIEPLEYKSFVVTDRGQYQEIGVVVNVGDSVEWVKEGDKVFFDSWLAGKYELPDGKYMWLVHWKDIKAVDGN